MIETVDLPVQAAAPWLPLLKAVELFLATFVLEDAAAAGAGLLLAAGMISWPAAFFSCFLGIWIGDAGLYALARFGGRKWLERSSLSKYSSRVERSEQWFAERGLALLIFSRCVPGARLPTYLAAGFLRLPLPRFLLVTGLAALVWTLAILWLANRLGAPAAHWLSSWRHGTLALIAAGAVLFVVFQLLRRVLAGANLRSMAARLDRWRHWEFWPAWMFYPPVVLYCAWLAIKHRSLTAPTAANPGMYSGGLVGESKFATLKDLMKTCPDFTAEAILIAGGTREERLAQLDQAAAHFAGGAGQETGYPLMLKPDVGQRGAGVKLIRSREQAADYLRQTNAPLLAQRYAPGPFEAGVFYYRFPGEERGTIFAITEKVFPAITGDGRRTIGELIELEPRARLIAGTYRRRFAARLDDVLPAGAALKLVETGNHAQGCIFRDGQRLWSAALEARMDEISRGLDGFFIGRYDLRYANEDDLRAGKQFQIIELNGAASEATCIYDARNSLRAAYRTLFRQWDLVFAIGQENRRRGAAPAKFFSVWKTWRKYLRTAADYPAAD